MTEPQASPRDTPALQMPGCRPREAEQPVDFPRRDVDQHQVHRVHLNLNTADQVGFNELNDTLNTGFTSL